MHSIQPGTLVTTFSRVVGILEIVAGSEPAPNSRDQLCRVSMDGRTMLRRMSELRPLSEPHQPDGDADCRVPLANVWGDDE